MSSSSQYKSATLTPPYPPTTTIKNNKGYLHGFYETPPSSLTTTSIWDQKGISGQDIIGFCIVNGEQTCRELIANQMKPILNYGKAFFYIYRKTPAFGPKSKGWYNINQNTVYIFVQLAKYRTWDTEDKMIHNVACLCAAFDAVNPWIKEIKMGSAHFKRNPFDNDFCETLTSEVIVTGLMKTPYEYCNL